MKIGHHHKRLLTTSSPLFFSSFTSRTFSGRIHFSIETIHSCVLGGGNDISPQEPAHRVASCCFLSISFVKIAASDLFSLNFFFFFFFYHLGLKCDTTADWRKRMQRTRSPERCRADAHQMTTDAKGRFPMRRHD